MNVKASRFWATPFFLALKKKVFHFGDLFVYLVIVPTLASILYFGVIASDVYISESRFVVRSPQSQTPEMGIGGALAAMGMSKTGQDGFIVVNYVNSMDAMMAINQTIPLRTLFTSHQIDIFNRFASFYWNESYERLLLYLNKHVEIIFDPLSSIAILSVRAYTKESAHAINLQLLEQSEALVNRMSDKARQDLIDFALFEVATARANLEKADIALIKFRSENSTGNANFIAKFQQLQLERDTAEKQLGSAIAALEQARIDAQRKRLYIERIVDPNVPDYPLEPKRWYGILTTFLLALIVWGVVRMVIAGVREHHA
jgi:capsular polysaccharide transport system permease protein